MNITVFLPVFVSAKAAGCFSCRLAETDTKMTEIMKANCLCNLRNAHIVAIAQQLFGPLHAALGQQVGVGPTVGLFELPTEICPAASAQPCHIVQRNIFGKKLFYIGVGYIHSVSGKSFPCLLPADHLF